MTRAREGAGPTRHNERRLRLVDGAGPVAADDRDASAREVDWSILMARSQDGNGAAYERLLTEVTPFLRARCSRRGIGQPDIEDTVQDILLTLHAIRATYDPTRPFGPWLVAIANRRIVDRLRRQSRRNAINAALIPLTSGTVDGTEIAEGAIDRAKLVAELAQLPDAQRQAIQLLKLEEQTLRQASSTTGRSISSLKVLTHRAITRLRRVLIGEENH
ncbi:MAG: sigma-70 family RNA polymerase sigma factor [Rhodobacteraceae bacterium]|nr:sigma-70 family RNA polymerase sigma factor [Paracoccaceae bacterium]